MTLNIAIPPLISTLPSLAHKLLIIHETIILYNIHFDLKYNITIYKILEILSIQLTNCLVDRKKNM